MLKGSLRMDYQQVTTRFSVQNNVFNELIFLVKCFSKSRSTKNFLFSTGAAIFIQFKHMSRQPSVRLLVRAIVFHSFSFVAFSMVIVCLTKGWTSCASKLHIYRSGNTCILPIEYFVFFYFCSDNWQSYSTVHIFPACFAVLFTPIEVINIAFAEYISKNLLIGWCIKLFHPPTSIATIFLSLCNKRLYICLNLILTLTIKPDKTGIETLMNAHFDRK